MMPMLNRPPEEGSPAAVGAAWTLHLYTASGAVVALLAARAFVEGDPREGFL